MVAILDTAGTAPVLPLVDGVRSYTFLNGLMGLEGDGTLVAVGALAGQVEGATGVVDTTYTLAGAVALNSDGVIEAFGTTPAVALTPAGLSPVVDVGIGFQLGMAVLADGSVIEWGPAAGTGLGGPPGGGVVEIDCGDHCGIALLEDGSVVTWGQGSAVGQEPAMTDAYSVHSGLRGEAFAVVKTDGTLVTWPTAGTFDGPGVVATDLGSLPPDQVVIQEANALPCGRLLPMSDEKDAGAAHLIKIHSYSPATYQWKLDGVDLPGETKPFLYIDSVEYADRGDYTVLMTNANGAVETTASALSLNLDDQTIGFPAIADKTFGDADFDVTATATSSLPVEFTIVSGPATVSGATVSITGAGTVVVRASQAGDSQYDPAPDVDQSFTVAKLPATVTLSDLAYIYDGAPKSATVVTDPAGLSVAVTYGGDPTPPSGGGDYAVVATIDDPNYSGSASDTLSIGQAAQSISFAPLGDVVFGDAPVQLTATASSGLAINYVIVSGPASMSGSTISYTGGGEVTVGAEQLGDDNFQPANPVTQSFTIAPATQTINFPAIGTRTFGDGNFLPPASATSSLPVTLIVVSGPAVSPDGNSLTLTGAGVVTVRVVQGGNASWQAAADVQQSFTVEKQPQLIDFTALEDRVFDSGDFNLVASASSALAVEFSVVDGPATVSGSTLTMTGVGTITVRASQAGDDDFLAADDVDHAFVSGYSLAITSDTGGDAAADPVKAVYIPGETISLSMVEFGGYRFTGWSGDLSGTDSPISLVMDANKTVDAEFKRIWTLGVTSSEGGSVTVEPDKEEYLNGDVITLTPVPDTGYELEEWQDDATGTESPLGLTLGENTSIHAQFIDVQVPDVAILSPGAGITNNQFTVLFGSVADNHEVASVRWERDGVDQGALEFTGGFFNVTSLVLKPGDNLFRVFALDVEGNEGVSEVTINWTPDRTLSLANPPEVREGKLVTLPMAIESIGNVGGMTYVIGYDPSFLGSPEVLLTGPVASGINQINTDTAGEVRITFALPATTLPAGNVDLGTVNFRARSVPFNLTTQFDLEVLDVAGSDGNQIPFGTHKVGAEGRILQRTYTGDINTNDRLDTGDAFLMQRMLAGLDEIRTWDHSLNDLNTSGQMDSGDVIRVLRTVVGLDPQPSPPQAALRVAKNNESGPRATMLMNQSYGSEGDEITVQVRIDEIGYAPSGASFTLDYPADALRLTDATSHTKGAIVPNGSFVLWNLAPSQNDYDNQSGSISFVASNSAAWPGADSGGVIAEFVFQVQAGASTQAFWPIQLRGTEIPSEDGFDILTLSDSEIEFLGQPTTFDSWRELHFDAAQLADGSISGVGGDPDNDGRYNLAEYGMGSDPTLADGADDIEAEIIDGSAAIGFNLSLTAIDLAYEVEVSGDLESWTGNGDGTVVTEIESTRRAADGRTDWITVRDLEPTANGRRFMRIRFELVE